MNYQITLWEMRKGGITWEREEKTVIFGKVRT